MIDPHHLLHSIVDPRLHALDMWSPTARQLIMGTMAKESLLKYVRQIGGGPALGYGQMEPTTYHSLWDNWLVARPNIGAIIMGGANFQRPSHEELVRNPYLAVDMCRIKYRSRPGWPDEGDVVSLGEYWKLQYNTYKGAGTVEEFVESFELVREALGM